METTIYRGVILGLYRDDGKENGNYYLVIIWGIMEKKMETMGIIGFIRAILVSWRPIVSKLGNPSTLLDPKLKLL